MKLLMDFFYCWDRGKPDIDLRVDGNGNIGYWMTYSNETCERICKVSKIIVVRQHPDYVELRTEVKIIELYIDKYIIRDIL